MEREEGLPAHLGIIMDGNGRWAEKRKLKRSQGHREGLKSAKALVKEASRLGIPFLSLYVFSTENWKRTEDEISYLMFLIKQYLKKEYNFYLKNQVKVVHSGNLEVLPADVRKDIEDISRETASFSGTTVNLLINYGGRDEIVRAANRLIHNGRSILLNEDSIQKNLDHPEIPNLDLVIRTAGEQRLSNFMIWQAAYAEYYYTDTLWPDFNEEELAKALKFYKQRNRKFGGYQA